MKHHYYTLLLVFAILLASTQAIAQPKHSVAFRPTFYNYTSTLGANNLKFSDVFTGKSGKGIELSYYYRFAQNTHLVVPVKYGTSFFPDRVISTLRKETFGNLDVLLQHNFFKYGNFINPFLHFGIGTHYNFNRGDFDMNFPAAIGLNVRLSDGLYASVQTQYRFTADALDGWHHGIGVHMFLDGETPPPPPPPILDRDGDGINDPDDACPDDPGPAATQGCPDRDEDGVADKDDACPDDPGPAALSGCPDRDGDGIVDKDDACPDQPGPVATKGCPDRDGDGIVDKDDACPDQPGPVATKGCPDRDGDGIIDSEDRCPDQKGTLAGKGCPDTDGDGVYDPDDRCVDKPGPASNKGCPEITQEDKIKLANVVKNVQFATGSANLLQQSYKVLDEVAGLMAKYPEYKLTISGHTDNVGNDASNQVLSEKRAKACYDYLLGTGVAAGRMSHAGYGESKPIADNKTSEGRRQNRRVDFDLTVE